MTKVRVTQGPKAEGDGSSQERWVGFWDSAITLCTKLYIVATARASRIQGK